MTRGEGLGIASIVSAVAPHAWQRVILMPMRMRIDEALRECALSASGDGAVPK